MGREEMKMLFGKFMGRCFGPENAGPPSSLTRYPESMDNSPICTNPLTDFFTFGLTPSEAFLKLDSEIIRLETQLISLRGLRNTLPPISYIPNEVLSKIFLECHEHDTEPISGLDGSIRDLRARRGKMRLALSWVSSRWRSVALSCTELWSFMTGKDPDYIDACALRSRSLDLSLSLRELTLRSATPDNLGLFGVNHPRLQHLILTYVLFDWDSLLTSARNLTTLHVDCPRNKISIALLSEKLGTMPALTDCKLVKCLGISFGSSGKQTTLPNLQHLVLGDEYRSFTFLEHLDIPRASVHVISQQYSTDASAFRGMFQSLKIYQRKTTYWARDAIRHILFDYTDMKAFTLSISTSLPKLSSETHYPPSEQQVSRHFTINIGSYELPDECDPGLILCHHLPFTPTGLESAFLKGVLREALYCLAQVMNIRILKLLPIKREEAVGICVSKVKMGGLYTGPLDAPEELFSSVEDLEVDSVRYSSFMEFHNSVNRRV
ncbi:hypothetical protein BDN72DRAFT_962338 [Pluteus cervinus]|uniref:Uncharacterized protein n=1 Tax=Pluteus cervinus TaxID=181527 RepID=A0ACD3AK25_9AGAR|nr:hypothetical protein BDN72DRAFT_962338 [Pluteus cervinus]